MRAFHPSQATETWRQQSGAQFKGGRKGLPYQELTGISTVKGCPNSLVREARVKEDKDRILIYTI